MRRMGSALRLCCQGSDFGNIPLTRVTEARSKAFELVYINVLLRCASSCAPAVSGC